MDKNLLSQEEIDALLRGTPQEPREEIAFDLDVLTELVQACAQMAAVQLQKQLAPHITLQGAKGWKSQWQSFLAELPDEEYLAARARYEGEFFGVALFLFSQQSLQATAGTLGRRGEDLMEAIAQGFSQSLYSILQGSFRASYGTVYRGSKAGLVDQLPLGETEAVTAFEVIFAVGTELRLEGLLILPVDVASDLLYVLNQERGWGGEGSGPVYRAEFPSLRPAAGAEENADLELLMDVDLELEVELGRAQIRVADLLEFNVDSVLVLDKTAGEPLSVFINDRELGRGEVILIDDTLGVKLSDIINPQTRLEEM
ncbi:MAG: flagellar motor switch protein FliN [Limnochordia bacterium]|jgi:flagellar motor switch protein FliN/FliY